MSDLIRVTRREDGAQLVLEVIGQDFEQPRRLEARAGLVVFQHAIEQDAGGVDVGVCAGLREEVTIAARIEKS